MRPYIFGLFVLISAVLAGQGKLEFKKTSHDFGQINEQNGSADYSFLFVNTGDLPVKITHVDASCGCTTPFWTKEEILPGDSGIVSVRYNPFNRPGAFAKSLQVTSTGFKAKVALHIKGRVIPKPRSVESDLPTKIGAMRVKHRAFNMGKITTEKAIEKGFEVYNDSDSVFSFLTGEMKLPGHISMIFDPNELQPGERGNILITYDPKAMNNLGYQSDMIMLKTSEVDTIEKSFYVVTTIQEYFPPLTEEELANAPKLTFSKKSHDFRKVAKDAIVETTFVLINAGKSDLNIRATKTNCECTISELESDTIKPGEKVKMKVTFDTKGRKGKQFKNITIFSNDPVASAQRVMIKAEVEN